jgi:hypothetical protein
MEFDYHARTQDVEDMVSQDLQSRHARVNENAARNLADIQVGRVGDRVKCIDSFGMEFDYHARTPGEGDMFSQNLQISVARAKAQAAQKLADTRLGRLGDRLKCIDSFGMEFDYHAVAPVAKVILENISHGPPHDTELRSPHHASDKTLAAVPELIQYFQMMSFKTYWEYCESEVCESESGEGNEIDVAFEKDRAVEGKRKSCLRARRHTTSSNYLEKRRQKNGRNCDDLTDEIDVMAMAIF